MLKKMNISSGTTRLKRQALGGVIIVLLGLIHLNASISEIKINGQVQNNNSVKIFFELPDAISWNNLKLFRSTHPISSDSIDPIRFPITTYELTSLNLKAGFLDKSLAQNVTYYYLAAAISGKSDTILSNVISFVMPEIELPQLSRPEIWIDKIHYFLEIRDQAKTIKRYPIILGRDPIKRKLHQDFATTPEGIYRVTNRKLRSTFRHAFDIDYPNSTDHIRYDLLKSAGKIPKGKGIGGEIQIHGQMRHWRLERNWTWGCIALRNEDIDELFELKEIRTGTPVYILGKQLTREDLLLIQRKWDSKDIREIQDRLREQGYYSGISDGVIGKQTRQALGNYQMAQGYPVTCELDTRTITDLLPSSRE